MYDIDSLHQAMDAGSRLCCSCSHEPGQALPQSPGDVVPLSQISSLQTVELTDGRAVENGDGVTG